MKHKFFLYFIFYFANFVTFSENVSLICNSIRSKNSCECYTHIDPKSFIPLNEALCEYLELEDFPELDAMDPLNSLDISHNNLKELRTKDVFKEFGESIMVLKFDHNSINNIEENFFNSFPNLTTLDLSHNNLTRISLNIFEKLEKLEVLDLSFNQIEDISDGAFKKLTNLKSLNLSYNYLEKVLENPTALIDNLGINENINCLTLENVGVTRIHSKCWNNFKNLIHLSVADNPLDDIPQTSSTLEYLDISGTNISDFHENHLKYINLKILKMSRMKKLTSLPDYAFYNLGNLEELTLTDTNLNNLNELSFGLMNRKSYPRQIKILDLARNRLTSLTHSFKFIIGETDHVDISFNPWNCDCNLLWMKEVDFPISKRSYMRCASPNELENKIVLELQPKDVPSCHPEIYGKKSHQTALLLMLMVIFALVVVITYLCLYSPMFSTKASRSQVAPDSPYSINSN